MQIFEIILRALKKDAFLMKKSEDCIEISNNAHGLKIVLLYLIII